MFLPSIFLVNADFAMKFIAGIASVSSILFFSGCIPCILATQIPVKVKDLVIIWLIRTSLSIIFSGLILAGAIQMGWIPDYQNTATTLEQQCKTNDGEACFQLGTLYSKGYIKPLEGQTKEASALTLLKKACDTNHTIACNSHTKMTNGFK